LLPGAAVCTACCHRLDGSVVEGLVTVIAPATPSAPEVALPVDSDDAHKVTQALTHWPFGAADEATVQALAQAPTQAQEPPTEQAPASEAAPLVAATPAPPATRLGALIVTDNGLRIPNQRSAVFNPLHVETTPPRNGYLEASRRQQSNFGSMRFELEDSGVHADCG
jgi:hypothetical protein